ncbi:MAG: autotransporter outer membrane beta-barrel domain-containing protein [Gammaproteobacteria bacterium]
MAYTKPLSAALWAAAIVSNAGWADCTPSQCNPPPPTPAPSPGDQTSSTDFSIQPETQAVAERQKGNQLSRVMSDVIFNRLMTDLHPLTQGKKRHRADQDEANPLGASADNDDAVLNSLWSNFQWSQLVSDNAALSAFETNIYQGTVGLDKRFGDVVLGAALTYAYADTTMLSGGVDFGNRANTVNLTPYAAYVLNDRFFLSLFSGYNYTQVNPIQVSPESEIDAYNTELAFNGLYFIDNWYTKGKIGVRYQHAHQKIDPVAPATSATRDNLDNWVYLADMDIGYSFLDGLRMFSGFLFEYNLHDPQINPNTATLSNRGDSTFYFYGGLDYAVSDAFSLGLKVQTDLSNEDINLTTVGLSAQLKL